MQRFFLIVAALAVAAWPTMVEAAAFDSGDRLSIPTDRVLSDDFYAAGRTVTIDGTVNGDVIVAGRTITITGTVNGNVWAAAENVTIAGHVSGSVHAAAGSVTSAATIGGDLTVLTGTLSLTGGSIGRDVYASAGTVESAAPIGRDFHASGEKISLSAPVQGSAKIHLSRSAHSQLRLLPGSGIGGNLDYTARQHLEQAPGVGIGGQTIYHESTVKHQNLWDRIRGQMYWFAAAIVLLIAVLLWARRGAWQAAGALMTSPGRSVLAGLLFLIIVPVVTVLLAVFIIGLPLALFTAALYALVIYTSKIFVALLIGRILITRQPERFWSSFGAGLIGLVFLYILYAVPVVGGFALLFTIIVGTGAQVLTARRAYSDLREKYGS